MIGGGDDDEDEGEGAPVLVNGHTCEAGWWDAHQASYTKPRPAGWWTWHCLECGAPTTEAP